MGQVVTKLRIDTDEYQNRVRRVGAELSSLAHQCEVAGNSIDTTNSENLKLVKSLGSMQTVATTLRGKMNELNQAFLDAGQNYNTLTAAQKREPYGRYLAQSMEQLKVRIRETKNELAGLEGRSGEKVGFGQQVMSRLAPGAGFSLGNLGVNMAVGAARGAFRMLKDVVQDTVKTNMEFEQSNANLAAILGKTRDGIVELTENAKQLGGATKFTASEITELQTVLARRGLSQSQILDMTHGIANLAIATGTNLAQSAELAASTMQAFGMKATQMERIVSVLGVSTTKSALTTETLGTSLQYVAPAARAAGFSLEDTVAILGTLVNNGINASTAGTSLRQIFLSMNTSSGKLAKALGGPVKSFDDLLGALKRLKNEGGDSLDSVSKAVRVTALPAFLALINNADGLEKLRASIVDVDAELQKMADTQMNTAKGASIIMKSAWEGLKLTFEESNGPLKEALETLTKYINMYKEYRQLNNGGQGAVNTLIGDPEKFRKDTDKAADEYIRKWQAGRHELQMTGASAIYKGSDPYAFGLNNHVDGVMNIGKNFGKPFGMKDPVYGIAINPTEYASAYDEAAAKLKELLSVYEKLLPLSREYSSHQTKSTPEYKNGRTVMVNDDEYDRINKEIFKITGKNMSFDSLSKYLEQTYRDIKMYEAVKSKGQDAGAIPLDADPEEESTGGKLDKILEELKTKGDKHSEEANAIKARYEAMIAELDRETMSEREYTDKVFDLHDKMYGELVKLYSDDAKHQNNFLEQKAKNETKYNRDIYRITMGEVTAHLKESEAAQIASLDRKNMGDQEYADAVFAIQQDTFDKLLFFYQDDTKKHAEYLNAKLNNIRAYKEKSEQKLAPSLYTTREEQLAKKGELVQSYQGMYATGNKDQRVYAEGQIISLGKSIAMASTKMQGLQNLTAITSEWQNGLNGVVSGVDAVVNVFDTMKNAIKGNASAWEVFKSILNGGFTILNSVVTVMQTIETLQTVGILLTEAKSKANMKEASTAGAAAAAEAGKSVAAIPIVGAILAVAAIGAVAAAIAASAKKTEYHADGGIVGSDMFRPRGTDTVPTMLTPGELVLNRAQQSNLAAQLQAPKSSAGGAEFQPYVTGEVMWLGLNNWLKRTGQGEIVTTRR